MTNFQEKRSSRATSRSALSTPPNAPEPGDAPAIPHGPRSPLGMAFFRVMRAIMFDETPLPELDALPLAQLRLLWTVFYAPNATMKDFSERLGVSQSTVTQLADRLVRRSLIERSPDPTDRRVVRLHVSPTGRSILGEANARQEQVFQAIQGTLPRPDFETLLHHLLKLAEVAEQARTDVGRSLPPFPEPPAAGESGRETGEAGTQPVVDLMTRRVRGK